ncbi:MAG: hypothetical protein KDB22_28755, partial [Planctomycetales bacterium]|nr:hypothetical protein [Planctomycetales bacterium]
AQVAGLRIGDHEMGGWRFYHWDLLKRDSIENRDQCEQLLRTVSDQEGRFRFEKVKRHTPWLELYYTGEKTLAQRYSNLRDVDEAKLQELELVAQRPSEMIVKVNQAAYPKAAQIYLAADNYSHGVNAIQLPYSYEYRQLAESNRFDFLPAGEYRVSLMSANRSVGNGGFTSDTLASKTVRIEQGQRLEISFD